MTTHTSTTRFDVKFDSEGTRCSAWHYPSQSDQENSACIVMAHGLGGTRECGLAPYAERFSAEGYHVLVFDYRYFGDSDGEPRQLLKVSDQLKDWRAAIDFARQLKGVNSEQIILWGTSFSGGHVLSIAAEDQRLLAVSAQGPMVDGRAASLEILKYAGPVHLSKLSSCGLIDQARATLGMSPLYIPLIAEPGALAAMTSHDALSGYHAITNPGWRNEMSARTVLVLSLYRPISKAKKIRCPALIQVCNKDTVAPAKAAIKMAKLMPNTATLKQYDIGHFDIYTGKDFDIGIADQLAFYHNALHNARGMKL
jgi:pimeloyl-ACP methyl ester carboxylesterase